MIPNRPDDRDSAHFPKIQGGEPYHSAPSGMTSKIRTSPKRL